MRARLIAASNRSLEDEVAAGRFRSDLFYRLNVVNFRLPPLRDHRASIAPAARRFVEAAARRNGQEPPVISAATLRLLESYHWPGNLRELRNVVERAVVLRGGAEIAPDDLPDAIRRRPLWTSVDRSEQEDGVSIHSDGSADAEAFSRSTLAQIKRDAELARISEALRKHSNNRLRAASELGISRMTLYKKLYKYGLMTSGSRTDSAEHQTNRGA
jgi:DNA-binding NtrC family response regulator